MKLKITAIVLVFASFWAAIAVQGRYPKQTRTRNFSSSAVLRYMANNTLLASDNFQRPGPSLGANWTAYNWAVAGQIVSNVVEPTALSTTCGQTWNAVAWPNDQISEITLGTWTNEVGTFASLSVRNSASVKTLYDVDLTNNTALLYKIVAGVVTQLGTTQTVTIASGDVWALQAAGSAISVYQNGKRIIYIGDASIPSGAAGPGFSQFSSINATHTQVASWRGYNTIQQDGIWQKQGVIIPANATDLTATLQGTSNPSNILFEGNAQLLSGTVYKMWFSGGADVCYAESTDGVNWTRKVTAVITGQSFARLIKVGSTYNMYTQASPGGGSVNRYTSTDGINWVLANSSVLTLGTGGAWDSGFIYYFTPVYIDPNGIWHAIYLGGISVNTTPPNTGVATSPDGIVWTKYSGNPVVTNFAGGIPVLVGNTWYMWGFANQPGLGNATAALLDPTETVRMQSMDLINWTNPVHSIHHSQLFEGVNTNTAQALGSPVIDVNGKAYMYGTGSPSDAIAPPVYQITLAIAPAPLSSIVTKNEDAITKIVSDAFTSGAGSLSANWTKPTGGTALQITGGNLAEPTATGVDCQAVYTGVSFSADQYSEVTLTTLAASSFVSPLVRASTNSLTWYEINVSGPTGSAFTSTGIFKRIAGVSTQIGPLVQVTPQVGDVFRLSVVGNVLSLYQNGYLILQFQDYANSITTGRPGFKLNAASAVTNSQISLWAGGNANVTPNYMSDIANNSTLKPCQLFARNPSGGLSAITTDGNGNLNIAGSSSTVDTINNGIATPVMLYGRASGILSAATTDGSGNGNGTGTA